MRLVSFCPFFRHPASALAARRRAAARVWLAAALIALFAAGPIAAQAAGPAPSAGKAEAKSLDFYFAALAAAPDDASAARARGRIEAHWATTGSPTADLLAARAAIAVAGGDPGLALDLADAALVLAPTWADLFHRRALVHLAGGDTARARADLAATLGREPRHIGALSTLATVAERDGHAADALKWLRRLATIDPRNPALASGRIERLTIEVEGREL
jgi:tetratricopeptide (TPR) repeat protein